MPTAPASAGGGIVAAELESRLSVCGEWADPTLVRCTPSTTGGAATVGGAGIVKADGAGTAAAEGGARTESDEAVVAVLSREMARMPAMPADTVSAVRTARRPAI